MYLIQILLPLYDNAGKSIAKRHFTDLSSQLARRFGGVTAYTRAPATGLWRARGKTTRRDDIVVYEVMAKELARAWWRSQRVALEHTFRQQRVVIRSQRIGIL